MRTIREIQKCKDYTIVQFVDNKKYTLYNRKDKKFANKEFDKIEYFSYFPFDGMWRNYKQLFSFSGFVFTDSDGTFMTNELGHYLIDEEKYFDFLKRFADLSPEKALKNEDKYSFEPYTIDFAMMKAAFMAYEKEYTDIYKKLKGEDGERSIKIFMDDQKNQFKAIVTDKQEELAEYIANMTGERMNIESPAAPHAPTNYIKGIFGEEPFLENI